MLPPYPMVSFASDQNDLLSGVVQCGFGSNATLFEYQVGAVSIEIQDPFSRVIQEQLLMESRVLDVT